MRGLYFSRRWFYGGITHQPAVAAEAVPDVQKTEQPAHKDQRNAGPAPNVKLPSLKDAPTETKATKEQLSVEVESMAVAKTETPNLKIVQKKETAVAKKHLERTATESVEAPPKVTKKLSAKNDGKLFDEGDVGFAEPIRMKSFGGKQEHDRKNSALIGSVPGPVEVIDITNNSVIVTNPKTNLPMQVRVGGKLPNGQVVTSVDRQSGSVQTSGGVLRLN